MPRTAPPRPRMRGAAGTQPRGGSVRPTASRPPASSRAAAPEPAQEAGPSLARLLSVRALVLGVVALVAFSMLFPTIRAYLGQRAQLETLAADVAAAEAREGELQGELDRWSTQAYVEAQARERLGYVRPGETAFRVIDPEVVVETPPVETTPTGTGPALPAGGAVAPWYTTVWQSVELAGESPVEAGEG